MLTDNITSHLLKGKQSLLKVPHFVLVVYKSADDVFYTENWYFSK